RRGHWAAVGAEPERGARPWPLTAGGYRVQKYGQMSTKVDVSVLPQTELLNAVCSVRIARRGESWSESCLGSGAKDQGVYIIHHAGRIKYVGKIDGASMSFGIRLRREFQEAASQGRHIFPR